MLARLLEESRPVRITTAMLALELGVSEAALYRHFASKAQMFEGLIEFIELTLFGLINRLEMEEPSAALRVEKMLSLLLGFAQKNPGMTRVLTGEALINEDPRLQRRIDQLHDRIETTLKQALRFAVGEEHGPEDIDVAANANIMMCYVVGRWHQFVRSGFRRKPLEYWEAQRRELRVQA